ncbi:MAG: mechanosensitive ion channel [Promethearchaeota archaeon]|nr:MAG: mechanosensitive ion channel [Candidatus Lokiarchaeota archaeon]
MADPTLYDIFGQWLTSIWGNFPLESLGLEIPKFGLFLYLCIQIVIIVVYFLTNHFIRKKDVKFYKITPDLLNGLRFIIRIIVTIISVVFLIIFLHFEADSIWLILGIFTTAIAFASIKTVNNLIAGFWITLTRPFDVGDYVKIKEVEGIVTDISSNYTRIRHKTNNVTQIPNLECLKSKIINYTVDLEYYKSQIERLKVLAEQLAAPEGEVSDKLYQDIQSEIEEITQVRNEFEMIQDWLIGQKKGTSRETSIFVRKNKLVRYTFTLSLPREPETNAVKLDELCKKYREKFRITPDWKVVGMHYNIEYMFVIITPDPEDILEFYDDFLWDLYSVMNQ